MEPTVPSSLAGTLPPVTSGVRARTSSRSEEEDLKRQMMDEWKENVSKILGKKVTDYWKINQAAYQWVGRPSQETSMSGLLKSEKTEQDGKACRVARGLVFQPINDKGDIRGNMIIENHSNRTTAFMVSGSNSCHYNISPRIGKIAPGASIVAEITANLKAFTKETPLERDYFYVEILKTTADHSTAHQIMRTFNAATKTSIEGYYVDKLILFSPIVAGENDNNACDDETNENELKYSFDETIDPAVPYTGRRPRIVSSEGEGVNVQLASDAERLKQSGGQFEGIVRKTDWFGFIFIFLCLAMGFCSLIGYKIYFP